MDFRQLFTTQTWWGKLIGAFFGFLMAGPAGALFGILIGNFFDRGLTQHYSKHFWDYHIEKNQTKKRLFFQTIFSTLGHIAKADGRVSEEAIAFAKLIMKEMELNLKQKAEAQAYFSDGKSRDFNLIAAITQLQKAIHYDSTLIRLFIDTMYKALKLNGLSQKKLTIMNTILNGMQLASLYEQQHFSEDVGFYNHWRYTNQQSSHQQSTQAPVYNPLENAYALLKIKTDASKQDVKRAYRKLMSENHPDKLIAKKLPDYKIKEANDKTQQIRKAYELICTHKGW